jgi:hypothetical protein
LRVPEEEWQPILVSEHMTTFEIYD